MDVFELANRLSDIGLAALLIVILYGGWKEIWVWGHQLRDEREAAARQLAEKQRETEEWKAIALRLLPVADRAVKQLEHRGASPSPELSG